MKYFETCFKIYFEKYFYDKIGFIYNNVFKIFLRFNIFRYIFKNIFVSFYFQI